MITSSTAERTGLNGFVIEAATIAGKRANV
jgi:hypothetical protein